MSSACLCLENSRSTLRMLPRLMRTGPPEGTGDCAPEPPSEHLSRWDQDRRRDEVDALRVLRPLPPTPPPDRNGHSRRPRECGGRLRVPTPSPRGHPEADQRCETGNDEAPRPEQIPGPVLVRQSEVIERDRQI